MLTALYSQEGQPSPSLLLLQIISASSKEQQQSDLEHHMHWSCYLFANIKKVTGTQLLVRIMAFT